MRVSRRHFIKTTCLSCVAGGLSASILEGCATTTMFRAPILGSDLIIPYSAFPVQTRTAAHDRTFVIVHNERLQYPICVYRTGLNQYEALWMQCTHQGTELEMLGERFECPAHGSQFDNRGMVLHGPASANLKTFPVTAEIDQVKVSLK
jgi:Rieske Fe-S protein